MKILNSLIILGLITFSTSCSKKGTTPTNFALTLGAAVSNIGMNGGIILTGTNGTDKFRAGLTPDQANSFSLELPSGNWNFHAVGWMDDGNGMMTGESRCGHASATIEGTDTVVPLTLSSSQCSDGLIAPAASLDTAFAPSTPHFKKASFTSCLTLASVPAGDLCSGTSNQDRPGLSTSIRVAFRGNSSFGATLPSLSSKCYNHPAYTTQSFNNGYIPSQIRLPYDGTLPLGWDLIGYESKNCQERGAIYRMPDGVTGTLGVARIFDFLGSEIQVNFADNYIGEANSVFAALTPGDIVPKIACAPNCYPSTNLKPLDKSNPLRDDIKFQIWDSLGNVDGVSPYDVQGASSAFASSGINDLQLQTPVEIGSWGNNISVEFFDAGLTPGVLAQASCAGSSVSVTYDSGQGATTDDVVNAINTNCSHFLNATTGTPSETMVETASLTLTGGSDIINLTSRDNGEFNKLRDLMIGPLGAGLYRKGITNRTQLCDPGSYGSYTFNIDGEQITMELGAPSSATHPDFAPNAAASFERKLLLRFDGVPEEALYFNCSLDPGVGAFISKNDEDTGLVRTRQMFWSNVTAGAEWLEVASKEEDLSGTLIRQDYFLFKASATTDFDTYLLKANNSSGDYAFSVGRGSAGTLYTQGNMTTAGDTSTAFVREANDQVYTINSGLNQGSVTGITVEPNTLNAGMTAPNMFIGYDMSSFISGSDNFWDFTF